MKIYQLKKADRDIFSGLDPFERLAILDNPCGFALVCFTDEGENSIPAGLLVGTATEKLLTIDWMAVDPSLQGQGIGEELLLTVYDAADAGKIEDICAVISDAYERESFSKGAGEYFADRLFTEEKKAFADVIISLEELSGLSYFKQDSSKLPEPKELASFPASKANAILEQLFSKKDASGLVAPGHMKGVIDPELSFVFLDGNEPYGGFLVQKAGDYLMPIYYFAESDKEGAALILHSYEKAISKYKGSDVLILQRDEKSYKLLTAVMPGKDKSSVLWAKLEDYRNSR